MSEDSKLNKKWKMKQTKLSDTFQHSQELEDSNSELGGQMPNNLISQPENQQSEEGRKWSPNEPGALLHSGQNTTFTCVGFSEIDKYANQLLAAKFPNIKNFGDITKINPSELPDFDMFCGGFPCQSFSIAGKRRGFEDTRGTMFFEVARIIEVKRPKIVWLENVKGLLNHNKGETFSVLLETLSELGYEVQWMVLNSKFFGVPQNRERVFIIANLRGTTRPEILPFSINNREIIKSMPSQNTGTLCSQYARNPTDGSYVREINIVGNLNSDGWEKRHENIRRVYGTDGVAPTIPTAQGGGVMTKLAIPVLTPNREEKRQNGRRFKEDGDESFTLTKTDIYGVSDGFRIRRLTPIECERLQGFTDNWTAGFSDTQRYKMMGNAVTVNVIKAIADRIRNVK